MLPPVAMGNTTLWLRARSGSRSSTVFKAPENEALYDRRGDQQAVSVFNLLQQVDDLRAVEAGMQQVFGREVPHLVTHHFHTLPLQPALGALQQHPGTERWLGLPPSETTNIQTIRVERC